MTNRERIKKELDDGLAPKEISCPYPEWNDDRALCFGHTGLPSKTVCTACVSKWLDIGDNEEDKTE